MTIVDKIYYSSPCAVLHYSKVRNLSLNSPKIVNKFSRKYIDFLTENPRWGAGLLPLILTILIVLCLYFKPPDVGNNVWTAIWAVCLMTPWAFFMVMKFKVDFDIANNHQAINDRNFSLEAQISELDHFVEEKQRRLRKAYNYSKTPKTLLKEARRGLNYHDAVTDLNGALKNAVTRYLISVGRDKNASFVFKLLHPNENDEFVSLGDPQKLIGYAVPRPARKNTEIQVSDTESMVGKLWNEKGIDFLSYSSVAKAEKLGQFRVVYDEQRESMKSICCYRINNPLKEDLPLAIWSMDCDQEGVFPNKDEEKDYNELEKIAKSFACQLKLEYLYKIILDETADAYEETIRNNRKKQHVL